MWAVEITPFENICTRTKVNVLSTTTVMYIEIDKGVLTSETGMVSSKLGDVYRRFELKEKITNLFPKTRKGLLLSKRVMLIVLATLRLQIEHE